METIQSANTIVSQTVTSLSNTTDSLISKWTYTQVASELGFRLLGLSSFLNTKNHSFPDGNSETAFSREWTNEVRLTHLTLLDCARFVSHLISVSQKSDDLHQQNKAKQLRSFSLALRNYLILSEVILRTSSVNFQEWSAWSQILKKDVFSYEIVVNLIKEVTENGNYQLPQAFQDILINKPLPASLSADFRLILPKFGKILRCLNLIGELLEKDKPLQTALLYLATIKEQTDEMLNFINLRLLRFNNEEEPMFGALDCAVFATSMEIKKVYSIELGEVSTIRQTPLLYAKIEAAHGLLRDSFQQTLVGFAQLIESEIDAYKLFPNFQTKQEQSIILRSELWLAMKNVQEAEKNPETYPLIELHEKLNAFMKKAMKYLMYKDWETLERFIEEVIRTNNKTDLVPILHRFGAYLETLFGQVNMRVVLANHPFEPPK